jgi:hypothetical protein
MNVLKRFRRLRAPSRVTIGVVLALLVASAVLIALQPSLANHFGYALPGKDGLPYRIHVDGRDYSTYQVCADGDWLLCHLRS